MKSLIVAHAANNVIGDKNDLPWRGDLPADLKHFKELTVGSAVIMGRLTFESIGRPLPNRLNIVLSTKQLEIPGCRVVSGLDEAYEVIGEGSDSFVIGGQKLYELAIRSVDRLYITEIDASFDGDTFFVEIDPEKWALVNSEEHTSDEANKYNYRFLQYDAVR